MEDKTKADYINLLQSKQLTTEQIHIISKMEMLWIASETKAVVSLNAALDSLDKAKKIINNLNLDLDSYREREILRSKKGETWIK